MLMTLVGYELHMAWNVGRLPADTDGAMLLQSDLAVVLPEVNDDNVDDTDVSDDLTDTVLVWIVLTF